MLSRLLKGLNKQSSNTRDTEALSGGLLVPLGNYKAFFRERVQNKETQRARGESSNSEDSQKVKCPFLKGIKDITTAGT